MSSVVRFELLQKHEELLEEMAQLQEEIDILNLLLEKVRNEYYEINDKINKKQQSDKLNMVDIC